MPAITRARMAGRTPVIALIMGALLLRGLEASRLAAQIEGERGIAPVVNTGGIEVSGIAVNVPGKTAVDARAMGWKTAYRLAWAKLNGPKLDDAALSGLVSAVEVEHEAIGPHRYIASLSIAFDRDRAGVLLAHAGGRAGGQSAPKLVIPVLYSGGVAQVYEVRGPWQRAWAEFHTSASAIDYVRPVGSGGESLLITAGQPGRRSRLWWRGLLDPYGANDVLIPVARLERQWPGGPVIGTFTARHGPDNRVLASFTLTAPDDGGVPAMLSQAITRLDAIYAEALDAGALRGDVALSFDHPHVDPALTAIIAVGQRAEAEAAAKAASAAASATSLGLAPSPPGAHPVGGAGNSYTLQFASPDAHAVDAALAIVRGAPGVSAATTVSIAIGGTSVMRVSYKGTLAELGALLRARGWQVAPGAGNASGAGNAASRPKRPGA